MIAFEVTSAEVLLGALAMIGAVAGFLVESRRMRDDAATRERVAVLEERVARLTERADEVDDLFAAHDDEEPEPPPKATTRKR